MSLREKGDLEIYNAVTAMGIEFNLNKNFDKAAEFVKKTIQYMKSSGEPFAFYYMNKSTCNLPVVLQHPINNLMVSKATCVISNIPGPKQPFDMYGAKGITASGYPPFLGPLGIGICTVSIAENMTISITADTALCPDTKKFMGYYERALDKFIAETKDD